MSDVVWQAIIAGMVTIILAYMNQRTKDAVTEVAQKAENKAEEVKNTLVVTSQQQKEKLDEMAKINKATHTLVNGAMEQQLKIQAKTIKAKYELTKDPIDKVALDAAQSALEAHERAKEESEPNDDSFT